MANTHKRLKEIVKKEFEFLGKPRRWEVVLVGVDAWINGGVHDAPFEFALIDTHHPAGLPPGSPDAQLPAYDPAALVGILAGHGRTGAFPLLKMNVAPAYIPPHVPHTPAPSCSPPSPPTIVQYAHSVGAMNAYMLRAIHAVQKDECCVYFRDAGVAEADAGWGWCGAEWERGGERENRSKKYKEQQRKPRHKREKEKDGPSPNNPSNGPCTRSCGPRLLRSLAHHAAAALARASLQSIARQAPPRTGSSRISSTGIGAGEKGVSNSTIAPVTGALPMLRNAKVWTMRSKTPLLLLRSHRNCSGSSSSSSTICMPVTLKTDYARQTLQPLNILALHTLLAFTLLKQAHETYTRQLLGLRGPKPRCTAGHPLQIEVTE
ncbi:hypothetical protein FIBSPDRAFT_939932 [Athelia psychrophila]|uniref:Uncharacterized protein n=1 Tax=Athelia psychrophila TaxID=1759441 RepID=A0A167WYJ6_9AGAM|nr:hypothetical protein FIBSPDRAFT_939932 [Fibularhizoctonia sp. CBS 109695]